MNLKKWYSLRSPEYVRKRAVALLGRYGITPSKAVERVVDSVNLLAEHGCAPTFPVPARVVQRYPKFFRNLQDADVEISVHGYDHVALATYPPAEACKQLIKAADAFAQHGIESYGFRCPYLSCTKGLIKALPQGTFDYSSNKAIEWDVIPLADEPVAQPAIGDVLDRVYKPASARATVSAPSIYSNIVEIPVSLPDDLELHDACCLDPVAMGRAWSEMLDLTHQRGELFVLMYHPELTAACLQPLAVVLTRASYMQPLVWISRLRDISSWWREKVCYSVDIKRTLDGLKLSFVCSERATILVRGVENDGSQLPWDIEYNRLSAPMLRAPAEPFPLLGLEAGAPEQTVSFLREQGYLLDTSQTARRCAVYLDAETLRRLNSNVDLIDYIERSSGPLVKYGRWPDGAKSALSITGDLDALTLLDYATRLWVH